MTRNWTEWELNLKESFEEINASPTPDQLNYIKQKISESQQPRKKTKIFAASTAALLTVLLIIGVQFFHKQNERGLNLPDRQLLSALQTQEARESLNCTFLDKETAYDPLLPEQQLLALLQKLEIADSSSDCILYHQTWEEDGILVFSSTLDEDHKGMVWRANFLRIIDGDWKWYGGEVLNIDFPAKQAVEQGIAPIYTFVSPHETTPFPLIYGDTMNPRVSSVVITDPNGLEQSATYFRGIWGGHSLWFAILSNLSGPEYTIQELDSEGRTIGTYSYLEK